MSCVEISSATVDCTRRTIVSVTVICGASEAWSVRVSGWGGFDAISRRALLQINDNFPADQHQYAW